MRPAFTVLRIQKLKTWGAVAGSGKHNQRERDTLNADASRVPENQVLAGHKGMDFVATCKEVIGNQTIRKNAVLGVEILLSASPTYFRPDAPDQAGKYDKEKLEAWKDASMDWLHYKYGKRVVSATLHLDEATPHIHALLVPLDDKGKLNCRALFGGSRHTLSILQTDYADAVSQLGIERGIKNSKATHKKVSQYYTLTQAEGTQKIPKAEKYDPPELPSKLSRMSDEALKKFSRAAAISGAEAQRKIATEVASSLRNEISYLKDLNTKFKRANSNLAQENELLQDKLKRLRHIPLERVLKRMFSAKGPYDKDGSRYFTVPDIGNVFCAKSTWSINNKKYGKGAIDLVMALKDYEQEKLSLAVGELGYVFGKDDTAAELADRLFSNAQRTVEENIKMFVPQKEKQPQQKLTRDVER